MSLPLFLTSRFPIYHRSNFSRESLGKALADRENELKTSHQKELESMEAAHRIAVDALRDELTKEKESIMRSYHELEAKYNPFEYPHNNSQAAKAYTPI